MRSARSYDREIRRLAVPALGSLAAEPLYVLVDTALVGQLGREPLAGLAIAGTILTTSFWIFNFLAYGTTSLVARSIGARNPAAAATHVVQGLWAAAAIGGAVTLGGLLAATAAVSAMGGEGIVAAHALTYLRISLLGAPAVLVTLVGMGYSRGLQDTRTPFAIAITANIVNLVLELIFIFSLGWGVAGSAWATVIAQSGAAAVYLAILARGIRAQQVSLRPHWTRMRALVSLGTPLVLRTASLLAALTVATAVAARMGTVAVASHQIAFQVWSFLALALDAIAIAGQAMIGKLLGEGDAAGARAATRRMIVWGLIAGTASAAMVVIARPWLVTVFTDDALVRAAAGSALWVVAAIQPLGAYVFVLDGVLIGAGDARFLARAMAIASFVVFIPAALGILALGGGLVWLWAALGALMIARAVGLGLRAAGNAWLVTGPPRA